MKQSSAEATHISPRGTLRILVAHNLSRARNGGANRLIGFIHDELVRAGHRVDYFCSEDVPRGFNGRLSRFSFPLLVFRHALSCARAGKPYDIINIHEPSAAAVIVGRSALRKPAIVVTSYGVELRWWQQQLQEMRAGRAGPGLKTRVVYPLTSLWQSSLGLRSADHVFCQNSEDRNFVMNRFDVPQDKITLIFAGADQTYARAARGRDYARAQHLIFAGTWIERKGIQELVAAFTVLARRYPALALTTLGTGAAEAAVLGAFPADIRARVHWLRATDDTENAAALAAADIYVLPTLFDGGPLTSVEAMMSGLPIITTPTGLMKEALRDGENGTFVPLRSPQAIVAAVEKLMGDPVLRAKIGRAAQRDALQNYTWERIAAPVEDAYRRLRQTSI